MCGAWWELNRKRKPPNEHLHKEISLEDEICEYLDVNGWLYAEGERPNMTARGRCSPADVIAWVEATQPKAWKALNKNHGPQGGEMVLGRFATQ